MDVDIFIQISIFEPFIFFIIADGNTKADKDRDKNILRKRFTFISV